MWAMSIQASAEAIDFSHSIVRFAHKALISIGKITASDKNSDTHTVKKLRY